MELYKLVSLDQVFKTDCTFKIRCHNISEAGDGMIDQKAGQHVDITVVVYWFSSQVCLQNLTVICV